MNYLRILFGLYRHYPNLWEKLRKSLSQSIFKRCWMKQKTVIITIAIIIVMVAMNIMMIMLMFMGLVIRMHMGLVRDGEVGVLLSGSRMERFAFELEVRPGSRDYPFHGIDALYFFFFFGVKIVFLYCCAAR